MFVGHTLLQYELPSQNAKADSLVAQRHAVIGVQILNIGIGAPSLGHRSALSDACFTTDWEELFLKVERGGGRVTVNERPTNQHDTGTQMCARFPSLLAFGIMTSQSLVTAFAL